MQVIRRPFPDCTETIKMEKRYEFITFVVFSLENILKTRGLFHLKVNRREKAKDKETRKKAIRLMHN